MLRLVFPLVLILFGVFYIVLTINIPKSNIGDPNSPMYFPLLIGLLLVVMSIIYFFQEFKKRHQKFTAFSQLLEKRTFIRIVVTIILAIIYAFIFERFGFLISTILFLGCIMFLINGYKRWLQNILVTVIFSGIAWYTFSQLLDVSLP
ncbi:tripartite tricarboxylate transporter TctB family protein [Staphylococcus shinii]|uniref:tripartite tricarboxylate transporter TctB family protein n=1 Tax=Staphylococcus shinii TaxID=2912228 RepID=UPI003F57F03F